jgi:hypothetical protein
MATNVYFPSVGTANSVVWTTANGAYNQRIRLTPTQDPNIYSGSYIADGKDITATSDPYGSGSVTFYNVLPGFYKLYLVDGYQYKSTGNPPYLFVPDSNGSTINALQYITVNTSSVPNSGSLAYSMGASDNRYLGINATASFAVSASYAPSSGGTTLSTGSTYPITSSYATTSSVAISASYAPTPFIAGTISTGSTYPITSSNAVSANNSVSSSYLSGSGTAVVTNINVNHTLTTDNGSVYTDGVGNLTVKNTLTVGSNSATAMTIDSLGNVYVGPSRTGWAAIIDNNGNITSSGNLIIPNITASLNGTASFAKNVKSAASASYFSGSSVTAHTLTINGRSYLDSGIITTDGNGAFTTNNTITAGNLYSDNGAFATDGFGKISATSMQLSAAFSSDNFLIQSDGSGNLTALSFLGNITGTATSASYVSATNVDGKVTSAASASTTTILSASIVNQNLNILLSTNSGSGQNIYQDYNVDITYNPSSSILFVPYISCSNITASNLLGTASFAKNSRSGSVVAVTDNSTYYLDLSPNTGSQPTNVDTSLTYNPSTKILTAQSFVGNLIGAATTASYVGKPAANKITRWNSSNILVTSSISDDGTQVGISKPVVGVISLGLSQEFNTAINPIFYIQNSDPNDINVVSVSLPDNINPTFTLQNGTGISHSIITMNPTASILFDNPLGLSVTNGVTASLQGTASVANAISFTPIAAVSASWISSSVFITTAQTASFITGSNVNGYVLNATSAISSSFASSSISASYISSSTGIIANFTQQQMSPLPLSCSALPSTATTGSRIYAFDCLTSKGTGDWCVFNGSNWLTSENITATTNIDSWSLSAWGAGLTARNTTCYSQINCDCLNANYLTNAAFVGTNGGSTSLTNVNSTWGSYYGIFSTTTVGSKAATWGSYWTQPVAGQTLMFGAALAMSSIATADKDWVLIGISDKYDYAAPTNGVYFLWDPVSTITATGANSASNWYCVAESASTFTVYDSGVAVGTTVAIPQRLAVIWDTTSTRYYINNSLVANISSSIPTGSIWGHKEVIVRTSGTGANRTIYTYNTIDLARRTTGRTIP